MYSAIRWISVLVVVCMGSVALSAIPNLNIQECKITGTVPPKIREVICKVATSVHGGEAPVNQLTVMLKRAPAAAVATKNLDAKNFMLTLLNSWMTGRKAQVARVEAHYQRVHLATAKTNAWSEPSVIFH